MYCNNLISMVILKAPLYTCVRDLKEIEKCFHFGDLVRSGLKGWCIANDFFPLCDTFISSLVSHSANFTT